MKRKEQKDQWRHYKTASLTGCGPLRRDYTREPPTPRTGVIQTKPRVGRASLRVNKVNPGAQRIKADWPGQTRR